MPLNKEILKTKRSVILSGCQITSWLDRFIDFNRTSMRLDLFWCLDVRKLSSLYLIIYIYGVFDFQDYFRQSYMISIIPI